MIQKYKYILLITFALTQTLFCQKNESSNLLTELKNKSSVDVALIYYQNAKEENPKQYNFNDENILNNYGYFILGKGNINGAIKVFKKLVAEFPNSSNAYDSFAESLFLNEEYDLSIANYKKSLELDLSNENAARMIARINISRNVKSQRAIRRYVPDDPELYKEIVAMDKEFFDAYNACDLEKQALILSDNIEFFHDKSGLSRSKKEILANTKKYICGKVTRILIEGSIEVYPIKNYGAIEIGFHKFKNKNEPNAISKPSKFVTIWKYENSSWLITKIISLH